MNGSLFGIMIMQTTMYFATYKKYVSRSPLLSIDSSFHQGSLVVKVIRGSLLLWWVRVGSLEMKGWGALPGRSAKFGL